jgi:hypothetical protein
MISYLQPLPIGNAVRCLLAPAAGSIRTKVLRKDTDDIASEADAAAAVVYDGSEASFVDTQTLTNGITYHYRAFDLVGGAWVGSESAQVTPLAITDLVGPDVLVVVRERLKAGLKAEVAAGRLVHETGAVPVQTAPPAFENTKWPVVSVHYRSLSLQDRGVGEIIAPDVFDIEDDEWLESEGGLAPQSLEIIGWSLNSDERNALRRAILKVILGNLSVFEAAGMSLIAPSQNDVDDMESYGAPVFSTVTSLGCLAAAAVQSVAAPISDVTVAATSSL